MFSKVKKEFWLIGFALVWLVFVTFLLQMNISFSVQGDEASFLQAAKNLYLHNLPSDDRPLLIAFINGFPLLFSFSSDSIYLWSFIVNCFSWVVSSVLIFKICKTRVGEKRALLAGIFFLLCLGNLAITFKLLSESVYIVMLLLSFYYLNSHLVTGSKKHLVYSICILTLSLLVKPLSLGLVLILLVFNWKKWRIIFLNRVAVLLFLSFGLVFFQMFSMKSQFGNFTVSYIDSFTYYNYLGTRADCLQKNIPFKQGDNDRYNYFLTLSSSAQRQVANADLQYQIQHNFPNLVRAYFINLTVNSSKGSAAIHGLQNYDDTKYFPQIHYLCKAISKVQNIVLTFSGLLLSLYLLLFNFRKFNFNTFISLTFLYIFFVSGISSDQGDRFHIVLYPLVILMFFTFYAKKVTH